MSSFLKDKQLSSQPFKNHKNTFTESEFTGDDSLLDSFSNSFHGPNSMSQGNSFILKDNYNSLNSTNNITFADDSWKKAPKKSSNLAYQICNRFPPKIKKQVESIIDYYENQLESQRQLFWRMTEKSKTEKHQAVALAQLEKQNIESYDTTQKDRRINKLQDKLLEKDKKITDLTKQITNLMVRCTKLNKELSSPSKSLRSSRAFDSMRQFQ